MLRKLCISILMILIASFLYACDESFSSLALRPQIETPIKAEILPGYHRRFDQDMFVFAEVSLVFSYDLSEFDTNQHDIINTQHLEAYGLTEDRGFEIVTNSTLSPIVVLKYTTSESFFNDFHLFEQIVSVGETWITITLNTIGKRYDALKYGINLDMMLSDLAMYEDYVYDFDSFVFHVLELRQRDVLSYGPDFIEFELLPTIIDHPGIIIRTYETYLEYFPENHLLIEPSFFDRRVIVYGSIGTSFSINLSDIEGMRMKNDRLEVVLELSGYDRLHTIGSTTRRFVASVSKMYLSDDIVDIDIYLNTHYQNGYLSKVPFELAYQLNPS